jgi:hypothetical protein
MLARKKQEINLSNHGQISQKQSPKSRVNYIHCYPANLIQEADLAMLTKHSLCGFGK